jgi:N-sulfoglucosamine sulfohydrolase
MRLLFTLLPLLALAAPNVPDSRPNILVCMADDWSAPHASILGDPSVRTPHFDAVAKAGRLYRNAFVSTPSCTPSRLSLLTGQHHWRLREGANLGGSLREDYLVYTELLRDAGYHIGHHGKGVWPSKHEFRQRDSFGPKYASFEAFLEARPAGQPYCFFFGGRDPHRPYEEGAGADIEVPAPPPIWPDHPELRADLADYYWHVQRFDGQVGKILSQLDASGEATRTMVVVTSDNGMPFPRAKATLYELGTKVPLAIRWPATFAQADIPDLVTLCDLAPTFLEAAGVPIPPAMTGRSLLADAPPRPYVLTGNERHSYLQPSRALRTPEYLFIHNIDPKSWVSGPGLYDHNIDPSPSKRLLADPKHKAFAEFATGRRPEFELYHVADDPYQIRNLAGKREHRQTRDRLARYLRAELLASGDPRSVPPGYETLRIEGWSVLVSTRLQEVHPEETRMALEVLTSQLQGVAGLPIPPETLADLRSTAIWFDLPKAGEKATGQFHPSERWLERNGRAVAKAWSVEYTNIPQWPREVIRMPMMVMHELAHAYHHQVLGFGHKEIDAAYKRAKASGIYDRVARKGSKPQPAYAIENSKEYFAETTEAFFGENDFYPFNRKELQEHDPEMFALLERIWETRK